MGDRDRVCQRAGCRQPASVTLSFRYDARQASLTDLADDKHPAHYDLCLAHADLLIVPRGWERLDRRTPRPEPELEAFVRSMGVRASVSEPVGGDPEEPAPQPQPVAPPPRRMNRYAALTAELPRLAAARARVAAEDADDGLHRAAGMYEPVTGAVMTEEQVLDGQLQMSIESEAEGVVVALTRTRQA
jgi:hypothetical protein